MGKRTTIQIKCPDIIKIQQGIMVQAAEDEELGTDQRRYDSNDRRAWDH